MNKKLNFEVVKYSNEYNLLIARGTNIIRENYKLSLSLSRECYFCSVDYLDFFLSTKDVEKYRNCVIFSCSFYLRKLSRYLNWKIEKSPTIYFYYLKNIENADVQYVSGKFFCSLVPYNKLKYYLTIYGIVGRRNEEVKIKKSQLIQITKENIERVFDVFVSHTNTPFFTDYTFDVRFAQQTKKRRFDLIEDDLCVLNSINLHPYPVFAITQYRTLPVFCREFLCLISDICSADNEIKNEKLREVYKSVVRFSDTSPEEEAYINGTADTFPGMFEIDRSNKLYNLILETDFSGRIAKF